MTYELYQILEVSPQASTEEIKRAYCWLVRKYSPKKEPEQFKKIQLAYKTLSEPKARDNYDVMQKYSDQIQKLVDQVQEKMQEEKWSDAISALKQLLILAPQFDTARNLLGLCYIQIENWDFAIKIYRTLTKTNPDVALYWNNFGQAYKQQAENLNSRVYDKPSLYSSARDYFQQAIKLEPFNSTSYLDIAETYLNERNYPEALHWAERAIYADGKADYNDFEAFFFICRVYLFTGESEKIEVTANHIISILPENIEIRQYAAHRFADLGYEVTKIAANLANFEIWRCACQFLRVAKKLNPSDSGISELYESTKDRVAAIDQYELLHQDSLIMNGFQRLAAFCLTDSFTFYDSEQDRKRFLNNILTEILASPTNTLIASLNQVKLHYPAVYKLNPELFHRIEQVTGLS
ncbi:MAG: DnaJ domain-containing protein [Scytonema sp. PMC 1069.18]|nr:DnaJ domain-containing protein [Scytonema sp. PMC 1069.18]MEC4883034.1 DnaJ domain-containing protein [Scytonema sp. PMC 1070.18]